MNLEDIVKTQQELIELLDTQIMQLTMMSKIELGDDVIVEIKRLKDIIWFDETYKNYCKSFKNQSIIEQYSFDTNPMTQQMFVEKVKKDSGFASQWGVKIGTRELSLTERGGLYVDKTNSNRDELMKQTYTSDEWDSIFLKQNIPTKEISLTYNDKTIRVYE